MGSPSPKGFRRLLRLNFVDHGGDGPTALLVHGALASRSYWNDNLEALTRHCRPVVVELWGHGRSPSPDDEHMYSPQGYAKQFELLREELGVERWWLIGQSMGAALVLHYALAQPSRAIGIVLTNSSSAFTTPDGWAQHTQEVTVDRSRAVLEQGVAALADSWINPGRSMRISDEVRAALAVEFDEHTATGIANSFRFTSPHLPLGERLTDISHPVLLTNGSEEGRFQRLLPMAQTIPDIEIVDLAASHAVNAHDPAGWNAAVERFMRRHADTRPL